MTDVILSAPPPVSAVVRRRTPRAVALECVLGVVRGAGGRPLRTRR